MVVQAKLAGSPPSESTGLWVIHSNSEEPDLVARTESVAPGASDAHSRRSNPFLWFRVEDSYLPLGSRRTRGRLAGSPIVDVGQ